MKTNNIKTKKQFNLIGEPYHQQFLEIQSTYGFAQRGGTNVLSKNSEHASRLVNKVNFLKSTELKSLVFNEIIFSN